MTFRKFLASCGMAEDGKTNITFVDKSEDVGEMYILGPIMAEKWFSEDVTPKEFRDQMEKIGNKKNVNIHINSPGGDVFAGNTIRGMIAKMPANVTVYVDGIAASIASVIAMGGDKIVMSPGSMMMIHNPMTFAYGYADDLRKTADTLDKVKLSIIEAYRTKAKTSEEEISNLMQDETWMTATEAVGYGFADEVDGVEPPAPAKNEAPDLDIYDRAVSVMNMRLKTLSL